MVAKAKHYVNNKEFLQAIIDWKEKVKDAESSGEDIPPVTDYIGECFMKIAQRLSYRPNFINYAFRLKKIGYGGIFFYVYIFSLVVMGKKLTFNFMQFFISTEKSFKLRLLIPINLDFILNAYSSSCLLCTSINTSKPNSCAKFSNLDAVSKSNNAIITRIQSAPICLLS